MLKLTAAETVYDSFEHNLKELSMADCRDKTRKHRLQNTTVLTLLGESSKMWVSRWTHCWKDLKCCWMCLSNACFHPQSYLHYVHLTTLQCFWTYITDVTEGFFALVQCLLQTTVLPHHLHGIGKDTNALQNTLPSYSCVWLQEEWYQDIIAAACWLGTMG